eukprot:TRINITY_DN6475_c0_g1_i1.p2 TRINITY_DN6475_c0_g1~~TRINITY_DN6475_c0_g1_i1.p2  ORF type:complete len:157 (-),score=30.82 TRINITY_DN6475_c0_g1_i1:27-497(-)
MDQQEVEALEACVEDIFTVCKAQLVKVRGVIQKTRNFGRTPLPDEIPRILEKRSEVLCRLLEGFEKTKEIIREEESEIEKELSYLVDTAFYYQRKAEGDFNDKWWVVVKDGVVLEHTKSEEEALNCLAGASGLCVFYQVGAEDTVYDIDTHETTEL